MYSIQKFFVFWVSFSTYEFAKKCMCKWEMNKVLKLGMFMSIVLLNQDLFGLIDGDQTSQI